MTWKISKNHNEGRVNFSHIVQVLCEGGYYLLVIWMNEGGYIDHYKSIVSYDSNLETYTQNNEIIIRLAYKIDEDDEIIDGMKVINGKLKKLSTKEMVTAISMIKCAL